MEPTYTITPTQTRLLQLIAAGYTTLQAARLLNISPNTARTHADHIRTQMNVCTIQGAATLAIQFGYIPLYHIQVRLKNPSNRPASPYSNPNRH